MAQNYGAMSVLKIGHGITGCINVNAAGKGKKNSR